MVEVSSGGEKERKKKYKTQNKGRNRRDKRKITDRDQ